MNLPRTEPERYEDAMTALEACIMDLYDQAVIAADDYMAFVDREEARATGWESRSALQLSCVRRGNHLDLKWTGVRWYGQRTIARWFVYESPLLVKPCLIQKTN